MEGRNGEELALEAVRIARGAFELGPLDLRLRPGRRLALLGPSASGKTTLLEVAAGLAAPASGDLARPARSAYLMQELGLWEHLGARANVAAVAGARDAARDALARVGFEGDGERPVRGLSGGERQRVAVARVLVCEAPLLLLDEPGAHLDRGSRELVADALRARAEELGAALVVASHELDEVVRYRPDELCVLEAGRVLASGRAEGLFAHPPSRAVAERLGFESFLPARVADGRARCALGELPVPAQSSGDVVLAWRPGALRAEPAAPDDPPATGGATAAVAERLWGPRGPSVVVELRSGARLRADADEEIRVGAHIRLRWGVPVVLAAGSGLDVPTPVESARE